jgi:kynureninase
VSSINPTHGPEAPKTMLIKLFRLEATPPLIPLKHKLGLEYAEKLDREDPLAGFKERFYIPAKECLDMDGKTRSVKPIIYMDGNSLGLLSRDAEAETVAELERWKDLTSRRSGIDKEAADLQAGMVGAEPGEVILTAGATANIHALVSTFYNPKGKRTKILADELNFPSDLYALAGQIRLRGRDPDKELVLVKSRDGRTIREEDIEASMSDEVSVALFPSVYYVSGQLLDMKRVTEAAHSHGVVVGYDCCHSAGVVPHRFSEWGVDYALWCNYKYMNAGTGAIAGLYVNRRHWGTTPGLPTWWGNSRTNRFMFLTKFKPAENAEAWHLGSSTSTGLALAPVLATSRMVHEAGLKRIREKSLKITGYLMYLVDELISKPPYNYSIGTPREDERRGGHVAVEHPDAQRVSMALAERGVIPDFRPPRTIRLSPIPLYTSYSEVWDVVQHLKAVVDNREHEMYQRDPRRME